MTALAAEGVSGAPRLANKISLDFRLDEQREREYEALVSRVWVFSQPTMHFRSFFPLPPSFPPHLFSHSPFSGTFQQEKEFSWLLENEYKQKVEIIDRCMEVMQGCPHVREHYVKF